MRRGGQYKDHPASQVTMATISLKLSYFMSLMMDKKSRQPTLYGWIFLILLAFFLFNVVFRRERPRELNARPDIGRFMNPLAAGNATILGQRDPQEEEFKAILAHNARGDGPLKQPDFDPNKHPDMHEHDPVKAKHMKRFGHPSPKEFPVGLLQQPRLLCPDNKIQLIVLVHSRPDGTGERSAIRRTWGIQTPEHFPHVQGVRWRTVFVMGMTETRFDMEAAKENEQYGDILQGQFKDTPFEGTRKLMLGMKWLNEHMENCIPKFVLKTHDNIFHNMAAITEWLERRFPDVSSLYAGKLLRRDRPVRNPADPYYVSYEDYSEDVLPDIIEGPEFLFSADAFVLLNEARGSAVPLAMEDAYLGLLAKRAGIKPSHNDHFQMLTRPSNICHTLKMFFVFKVLPYEHMEIFKRMRRAVQNNDCPDADMIDIDRDGAMLRREINL